MTCTSGHRVLDEDGEEPPGVQVLVVTPEHQHASGFPEASVHRAGVFLLSSNTSSCIHTRGYA